MCARNRIAVLLASAGAVAAASSAYGHFHVLMPDKVDPAPRGALRITYWMGHPFEHVLTDASKPKEFFAVSPGGERQNLLDAASEVKMPGQEGANFAGWRTGFETTERGDYIIGLATEPVIEDDQLNQVFVKTVVHVRVQKGWDRVLNQPAELVPLTRPYGLRPGSVFQVQVLKAGKPVGGALVEFEKYNPKPVPEEQLPSEEFITPVVKADPNGVATFILPEAGWYGIAAEVHADKVQVEGKSLPAVHHAVYWVFVGRQQDQ